MQMVKVTQEFNKMSSIFLFQIVDNNNGELCSHYPRKLVILEYQITPESRKHQSERLVGLIINTFTVVLWCAIENIDINRA